MISLSNNVQQSQQAQGTAHYTMPRTGETLTVKGIVNELFNIAGVNYTVLHESNSPQ